MKFASILFAPVILCASLCNYAGVSSGQEADSQLSEVQALLQALQERLQSDSAAGSSDKRVTRLGSSRVVEPQEEQLVVRIYDVSDLFVIAPAYAARRNSDLLDVGRPVFPQSTTALSTGLGGGGFGGGGFGGGGGAFNVSSEPAKVEVRQSHALHQFGGSASADPSGGISSRIALSDVISAITSTICPDCWDEVGGPASIAEIGSSLLISATEETHDQIAALLNLFRERWGSLRTISVSADWIWLQPGELDQVLVDDGSAFGLVDGEQFHAARRDENRRRGYSAVITCQNGQTVHTLSGEQSLSVTGMTPVVGGDKSEVGYSPQLALLHDGAVLQVTPIANRSGKFVTLDIHSRVTRQSAGNPTPQRNPFATHTVVQAIDRPQVMTQSLSTTLRIPVGEPMLIGGMTFEAQPGPDDPNLYLFVTVELQELRDDLDVAAPAVPE